MSTLSRAQAYAYAGAAGFTGSSLDTIVAISQAESGLRTDAIGPVGELGVTQIYLQAHPNVTKQCALSPACNYGAAYSISNNGTNFRPWCTAWSDGACGTKGGTYLGSGAPYQQFYGAGISASTSQAQTNENALTNIPFIGSSISGLQSTFINFSEEVAIFVIALVLVVMGVMLLAGKQIGGFTKDASKDAIGLL